MGRLLFKAVSVGGRATIVVIIGEFFHFRSSFSFILLSADLAYSGVHHLEEIREAGMEMPAVNQIEVTSHSGPLDPQHD